MLKEKFYSLVADLKKEKLKSFGEASLKAIGVVFGSYIIASIAGTLIVMLIIESKVEKRSTRPEEPSVFRDANATNYRNLKRDIIDRNLFNSDGEVPEESDPSAGEGEAGTALVWDESAPCKKTSLPIELLGTIYLSPGPNSLATVKEKGFSEADIYREGDKIYGNDQAIVHKIEMNRVVLNNSGSKECLELASVKAGPSSSPYEQPIAQAGPSPIPGKPVPTTEECSSVSLEEAYVAEQLGEGFANILSKGRLIPHNKENLMVGFKLIGVDSKSLFGKICLKNGDVITQVNETSLQQPDQGFALYQAFQDEREVAISFLRKGKDPMSVSVQIK